MRLILVIILVLSLDSISQATHISRPSVYSAVSSIWQTVHQPKFDSTMELDIHHVPTYIISVTHAIYEFYQNEEYWSQIPIDSFKVGPPIIHNKNAPDDECIILTKGHWRFYLGQSLLQASNFKLNVYIAEDNWDGQDLKRIFESIFPYLIKYDKHFKYEEDLMYDEH